MTLLILGNGFDIALGLKTSYSDFLASPEFEIDRSYGLYEKLRSHSPQNWIDIELIIKSHSQHTVGTSKEIPNYGRTEQQKMKEIAAPFEKEYRLLKTQLESYLRRIMAEARDTLHGKELFMNYAKSVLEPDKDLKIITFNYTGTAKKVFGDIAGVQICEIHNSIGNDIIFGVQDLNNEIHSEHAFILKESAANFGKNFDVRELETATKIIFYGYSLGETDFYYFQKFFKKIANSDKRQNIEITIFYYSANGSDPHYNDAKTAIDVNLKKMLGSNLANFKQNCNFNFKPTSWLRETFEVK